MTDFISREQVLDLIRRPSPLYDAIAALSCFPAPNPEQHDGRNVLGQTEDEFWAAVEQQDG